MKKICYIKISLLIGIISLLIVSGVTPLVIGYRIYGTQDRMLDKKVNDDFVLYRFNKYHYPQWYSSENQLIELEKSTYTKETTETPFIKKESIIRLGYSGGLMDSAWPMHGHDAQHTGRSPYSTVDTWDLIWRFKTLAWADTAVAIDDNGTIYVGSWDFYAVYPNGTLKWQYDSDGNFEACCPAIDENGVIYIGTWSGSVFLHAIYPDGTTKWKYPVGSMYTSPAIGDDGTIYFSDSGGQRIKALYHDGSLKWSFQANHVIYSSPAIGLDGTIFCGSHDNYIYALYPNNGTLRWKFKTEAWVHGSPTIADDGTVYIGSDDGYLYSLYPNNGTLKWKTNIGAVYGSPALDEDGTIYVGVWQKRFYAVYPNGTIKWSFNTGEGKVWGSSPALSDDDTIYFGTCDLEFTGGIEFIALYTDGTVKWRQRLNTFFSSPAIGEDGTVYIASSTTDDGYLNAFGIGDLEADANGPYYGLINEPVQFDGYSIGGYSPHFYFWDFGDGNTSAEEDPTHIYTEPGNYTVVFTVTDNTSNSSSDTTWAWIQETNSPPNKPSIDGPNRGNIGVSYDFKFTTVDLDGTPIWYYVDWGDDTNTGWFGPHTSGSEVTKSHTWNREDIFIISCKAKDPYDAESDWAEFEVEIPRNRIVSNLWYQWFLERFPMLERLLDLIRAG